jgi:NitT/TauT family transport system substrate-binding protein
MAGLAALGVSGIAAAKSPTKTKTKYYSRQLSALPKGVSLSGKPYTPAVKRLKQTQTLTVGIPSKLELEAPVFLAYDEGEFAKEHLRINFVYDTVPDLLTLLGENKVDLVYAGAQAAVFNALKAGVPIRWVSGVASAAPDSGLYMSDKYGTTATFNPSVLKGLTIGVNPGGLAAPSEYGLYAALKKGHVSPSQITMVPFSNISAMVSALNAGQLQGATVGPPYTAGITPGTAFQAEPGYPSTIQIAGYFATTNLTKNHRAAGIAFFQAIERTINTYLHGNYHKDQIVMHLLSQELGTTTQQLGAAPPVPFNLNIPPATLPALQQMYATVPNTLSYSGLVKPSQLVDLSLVVDAAEGQ